MHRRRFLQNLAATAAAVKTLTPSPAGAHDGGAAPIAQPAAAASAGPPRIDGHTLIAEFTRGSGSSSDRLAEKWAEKWKVYEDLRTRNGVITFVSSRGTTRILPKSAEASFADEGTPFLGLNNDELGLAGADLLADKLLAHGDDPDPDQVRSAAPPQGSAPQPGQGRGRWTTFVGTKEAYDVTPVYPAGSTRTWLPSQHFEELRVPTPAGPPPTSAAAASAPAASAPPSSSPTTGSLPVQTPQPRRYEGLVGGFMPATRTIIELSPTAYIEHIVFGDVTATDRFIVQTWHRSAKIEDGKVAKVVYGYTYPAYPPARQPPPADAFYRAMLTFAEYWDRLLADTVSATLPDRSWADMSKYCFAKELMIRPGGLSPKYGGVDRDYFGSEYDGFQDIFTSALYTNLEWGRFDTARLFLDDYFTHYVEPNGMVNMRGPETGQFGLTLLLLARYAAYTGDRALLLKHRAKIEATAKVLTDLHDISLKLPLQDPKHGLIQGWSESDACLHPRPDVWWQPYYQNNAFAARGLKDIARTWETLDTQGNGRSSTMRALAKEWRARSAQLTTTLVESMRANYRRDLTPPYMPPLPPARQGEATMPFREALAKERPSPQQWPHRLYAELLQPDVLPADLANQTIDTLRSYGGTVLGVVANIGQARPGPRSILGFISYGYAQMLLRLDRIEEYLLFLYSHRYHNHTRGSWTAGEVSGIRGGMPLFCIPAQQTIPLLVRWMLVLEDSDEERLYFGKAIPRQWIASGQPIAIAQAPTRWGRVDFDLSAASAATTITAKVALAKPGTPKEIQVKLRAPKQARVEAVTVNGKPATLAGPHGDTVIIQTGADQRFEVVARLA